MAPSSPGSNGAMDNANIPAGLSGVTAIPAGYVHSLALKSDGTVVGWGDNSAGQLNIPAGLSGVTAISAGGNPQPGTQERWDGRRLGR